MIVKLQWRQIKNLHLKIIIIVKNNVFFFWVRWIFKLKSIVKLKRRRNEKRMSVYKRDQIRLSSQNI